jgi:hypothetical protein
MILKMAPWIEQAGSWPTEGRHILAHHDDDTVIVYQAYRPLTGRYAAEHGFFGDGFSYRRMSWIKPNFLWMMYRSGWGTKEGQEITLAIRLRRPFFDSLLASAVSSTWDRELFPTESAWKQAVRRSSVLVQWDPDHDPSGSRVERRALQLGLRGEALQAFGRQELMEIIDISSFVAEQRSRMAVEGRRALVMPVERGYVPCDPAICRSLGLGQTERTEAERP